MPLLRPDRFPTRWRVAQSRVTIRTLAYSLGVASSSLKADAEPRYLIYYKLVTDLIGYESLARQWIKVTSHAGTSSTPVLL